MFDDIFQSESILICTTINPLDRGLIVIGDDYEFHNMFSSKLYRYVTLWHQLGIQENKGDIGGPRLLLPYTTIHPYQYPHRIVASFLACEHGDFRDYDIQYIMKCMESGLSSIYNDFVSSNESEQSSILSDIRTIVFPMLIGCKKLDLWFKNILPIIVNFANKIESIAKIKVCIIANKQVFDIVKHNYKMFDEIICQGKLTQHLYLVDQELYVQAN